MTVLHWALAKHAGLSTFHGPALVPELGEFPGVLPHTDRYLRAAWLGAEPIDFRPAETWTDELLDWDVKADLTRPRELRQSEGWVTVREGEAAGPLLVGCFETICWHLKGSDAWLDPAGSILVLETSELVLPPSEIDSYLTDLEQLGVFEAAAGLVFARPYGYSDPTALWEIVAQRTETSGIPVLANVEAGHPDPMITLPLGAEAELDAGRKLLRLVEAPTR